MIEHFKFTEHELKGLYEIQPFYATDERGGFVKDYSKEMFLANGIDHDLKEIFFTISHKGVIRALHFQREKQQAKLVRCISGHVFDVVVDLRKDSPTFKQWKGFDLTGENRKSLLVPEGFGHGYVVLEDSVVSYQCAEKFYGEYDDGIQWNAPELGIDWPLDNIGGEQNLIISNKDKNLLSFQEFDEKYGWF